MIHPYRFLKIRPEDRELGTIGSETADNIGNFLKDQYERIPEDKRQGFEQGVSEAATGIQEWNKQLREENYHGGIGPLDPFIAAGKAYNFVAEPIKKELSIQTGLAPSVIDAGEFGLDLFLGTKGLTKGKKLKKAVDYTNRIKNVSNVLDDTTSLNKKIRKILATNSQMSYGQARDLALLELKGVHPTRKLYRDRPDKDGLLTIGEVPVDESSEWAAKQQRLIDDEYDLTTLDPTRKFPANKRYAAAQRTTGKRTTSVQESIFRQYSQDLLNQLSEKIGIKFGPKTPGGIVNQHHKGVVRQIGATLDGLTDAAAKEGGDYMSKRLGFKLGYDIENAVPIPIEFHDRVHDIINDVIGISGTNIKGLEKKFNLPKHWQDTIGLRARIRSGMFDEVTDAIAESVKAIDVFWNGLQTRTNLAGLSRKEFMDATLDVVKLDEKLVNIPSTAFSKSTINATDSINTILERAGKADLKFPIFKSLDKELTKEALSLIIQENGKKALWEAVVSGQSSTTVFRTYGIKPSHKLIKAIEKDTKNWYQYFADQGFDIPPQGVKRTRGPGKNPPGTLRRKRDAEKFGKDTDLNPKNPDIDETKPIDAPDD